MMISPQDSNPGVWELNASSRRGSHSGTRHAAAAGRHARYEAPASRVAIFRLVAPSPPVPPPTQQATDPSGSTGVMVTTEPLSHYLCLACVGRAVDFG